MLTQQDEAQLETNFEKLRQRLKSPEALNPARGAPIFYFVYPPVLALIVRRLLPSWIARLRNQDGLEARILSLSDVIWQLIDNSGRWEEWLEVEENFDQEEANAAIRSVLTGNNALVQRIAQSVVVETQNTVSFITDVELLHPYLRSRHIESFLMNKVSIPTVFFYPGLHIGQYDLKFLEFHAEDSGYRSPIIGWLE